MYKSDFSDSTDGWTGEQNTLVRSDNGILEVAGNVNNNIRIALVPNAYPGNNIYFKLRVEFENVIDCYMARMYLFSYSSSNTIFYFNSKIYEATNISKQYNYLKSLVSGKKS